MLKEIPLARITVGNRYRKEMGDLELLAENIRANGLLQPIGVTEELELVFGERRLRAYRDVLKRTTIPARVVNVPSILAGEYAENEIRKDFTPSERVAIAAAIQRQIGSRQGQRTDRLRGKVPEVPPGTRTRETAAERAGFGNDKTYRQAARVVQNGTPGLIHAMDAGKVSISAASLLAGVGADEQDAVLELDEKAILRAAREIRTRKAEQRAEVQDARTVAPGRSASRSAQSNSTCRRSFVHHTTTGVHRGFSQSMFHLFGVSAVRCRLVRARTPPPPNALPRYA